MSEQSDYEKRLAAIEWHHHRRSKRQHEAHADRGWLLAQLRAVDTALTAAGIPADMGSPADRVKLLHKDADQQTSVSEKALAKLEAVNEALTAAGIPSDGRPPAERIGDLVLMPDLPDDAALRWADDVLDGEPDDRRADIAAALQKAVRDGAQHTDAEMGRGKHKYRLSRDADVRRIADLEAALRAAKVLADDGALGPAAADILRAAEMLRRWENGATVEHRCADPKACPMCPRSWTPADLEPRLADLATLKDNWDSYSAQAMRPTSVETMRVVLAHLSAAGMPKPDVCPTVNGGLQCEWTGLQGEIMAVEEGIEWWFHSDYNDASAEGRGVVVSTVEPLVRSFVALARGGLAASVRGPVDLGLHVEEPARRGVEQAEHHGFETGGDGAHAGSIAAAPESRKENRQASPIAPEPPPAKTGSMPVWPLVVDDVEKLGFEDPVRGLLLADMRERDAFSRAKHGTPLTSDNGRDHLRDAYQEVLDECVYLRNEIDRGDPTGIARELYLEALQHAACLRDAIERAVGAAPPARGMPILDPRQGPMHAWFGLSYASHLVLPRVVIQSMPIGWQTQLVALLGAARRRCEAAGVEIAEGYYVRAIDADGRFTDEDLPHYRHAPLLGDPAWATAARPTIGEDDPVERERDEALVEGVQHAIRVVELEKDKPAESPEHMRQNVLAALTRLAAAMMADAHGDSLADFKPLVKLMLDPEARARFNTSLAKIRVLTPAEAPLRPAAARMREYLNTHPDLCLGDKPITVAALARALMISEADMLAIEVGTKTTDAAGWREIQTALFCLGSGMKPEHIADPASSPAFARAMAREEEDAPARLFEGWPTTDTDRCPIPDGFEFDDPHGALHWDQGPIALLARSDSGPWICTRAAEDGDFERWCCAAITEEERVRIAADVSTLRDRRLWERDAVLVLESDCVAGEPRLAWRVPADRLKGLRCVFLDEPQPLTPPPVASTDEPERPWHRDGAVVVRTPNRLSVEAAREAAKATEALLRKGAQPPPDTWVDEPAVGDEPAGNAAS